MKALTRPRLPRQSSAGARRRPAGSHPRRRGDESTWRDALHFLSRRRLLLSRQRRPKVWHPAGLPVDPGRRSRRNTLTGVWTCGPQQVETSFNWVTPPADGREVTFAAVVVPAETTGGSSAPQLLQEHGCDGRTSEGVTESGPTRPFRRWTTFEAACCSSPPPLAQQNWSYSLETTVFVGTRFPLVATL